jgi:hypothetical protein
MTYNYGLSTHPSPDWGSCSPAWEPTLPVRQLGKGKKKES